MKTLPNNWIGYALFLSALALIAIVPFVLVLWLAMYVTPWWVAVPLACSASLLVFLKSVKFKS